MNCNAKNVLVTGANGQLGRTIQDFEPVEGIDFVFKSKEDLDITNKVALKELFDGNKFDYCINCAAYTNVEQAEQTPEIAYKINAEGVKNISEACKTTDTVLFHISTDYVFDGKKTTPYTEEDIPNPINEYGKSKLKGEEYVQQILEKYYIIRTSWLYSEYGHNFLKTILKLSKEKDQIQVVDDQIGSPTYARDLAEAILKIIKIESNHYGIYNLTNKGQISRFDFAKAALTIINSTIQPKSILTKEYPTDTLRPKHCVLSMEKTESIFKVVNHGWELSLNRAIRRLNLNRNLKLAINVSLEAGKEIMKIYDSKIAVEYKEDKSPLTKADKKANDIINSYLIPTEIPIISEENKQTDYDIRRTWETCWVVDPVDGTKEFIKRNGEFTVNIALVTNKKPILGVIYVPAVKTIYYANVENKVAYKAKLKSHEENIETILSLAKPLQPKNSNSNRIEVVGSRSHMNQDTLDFVENLKIQGKEVEIVSKGSSIKFCLVAEGNADVYPRYAPTMEWDTAAGQAICNAVGVSVISMKTNRPLMYNKENLVNHWFTVFKHISAG